MVNIKSLLSTIFLIICILILAITGLPNNLDIDSLTITEEFQNDNIAYENPECDEPFITTEECSINDDYIPHDEEQEPIDELANW